MEDSKPHLKKYDAVITGSGSNGIAAAIHLQQQGLSTVIYEKSSFPGGATKTAEITLPGFKHDIGSTVLPMAYSSPLFQQLPLEKYGLDGLLKIKKGDIAKRFQSYEKMIQF